MHCLTLFPPLLSLSLFLPFFKCDELGSINHAVCDKTGTLTQNKMAVQSVQGDEAELLLPVALCHSLNAFDDADGSPDEVALVRWAAQRGTSFINRGQGNSVFLSCSQWTLLAEQPFSSAARKMTVIVRNESNGQVWAFEKGAASTDWEALRGLRVLQVRRALITKTDSFDPKHVDWDGLSREMTIVGAVGMSDTLQGKKEN